MKPGTNTVWAQVVNSGPESSWPAVRNAFLIAIASAEKRVQIQSPYFVPDEAIEDALVAQSLAGVETRLMMTGVPGQDGSRGGRRSPTSTTSCAPAVGSFSTAPASSTPRR